MKTTSVESRFKQPIDSTDSSDISLSEVPTDLNNLESIDITCKAQKTSNSDYAMPTHQIVTIASSLNNVFSDDVVQNLEGISDLLESVEWRTWRELHDMTSQLQVNPLTKNTTLKDVIHAMLLEGISSYQAKSTRITNTCPLSAENHR